MQGTRAIPDGDSPGERSWAAAYRELLGRATESLDAADLETLAVASYLMGDDDRCASAWEAAHHEHASSGSDAEAARCSFWLAFCLMMRGQMARAGAWLGRTTGLLDDEPCSASGLVLIPRLLQALHAGEPQQARTLAARASEIAAAVGDDDVAAFARLGDGQACVALGDPAAATARFDEAMLTVTTGEVGPISRGVVYCAVILECMGLFDLRRAAEWTEVLAAWCDDEPEMVPYRGQCLVHRSQLLQARGEWGEAAEVVASACRHLAEPPHPALGLAHYQAAELHRLGGAFDAAAESYRRASASGHEPMPGLALLELASGDADAAAAGIRRALEETGASTPRPALLAAAVEIFRETNDLAAAREAADELAEVASANPTEVLQAMAGQASGSVALAEGDAAAALSLLREARSAWDRARMPYEAARTSVLLGLGCLAFGDRSSASLEFENAREVFESVAARPDVDRLWELRRRFEADPGPVPGAGAALSGRELEVLAHVAAGKTNPEIAAELSISRHTVGRHLENIFAKLGVSGRAAATAYAYEHDLL